MKHLTEPPPPLGNSVPAQVATVVLKALAKDPKDRYASIQEFASALQAAAEPGPPPTVQSKAQPEPKKTARQWFNEGLITVARFIYLL
jgi:hypothetical protein